MATAASSLADVTSSVVALATTVVDPDPAEAKGKGIVAAPTLSDGLSSADPANEGSSTSGSRNMQYGQSGYMYDQGTYYYPADVDPNMQYYYAYQVQQQQQQQQQQSRSQARPQALPVPTAQVPSIGITASTSIPTPLPVASIPLDPADSVSPSTLQAVLDPLAPSAVIPPQTSQLSDPTDPIQLTQQLQQLSLVGQSDVAASITQYPQYQNDYQSYKYQQQPAPVSPVVSSFAS